MRETNVPRWVRTNVQDFDEVFHSLAQIQDQALPRNAAGQYVNNLGGLNYNNATELTIKAGAITPPGPGIYIVETEGGASEDHLDTINGGIEGDILFLSLANPDHHLWITDDDNILTLQSRHYPTPASGGSRFLFDGTNWLLQTCGNWSLTYAKTVALDAGMSAAQIQGKIIEIPRQVGAGSPVFFQLADGHYELDDNLALSGFKGSSVYLQGNPTESGLHTDQGVHLDFSGANCNGIQVIGCECAVWIKNVRITVNTTDAWNRAVWLWQTPAGVEINGCFLEGNSTAKGRLAYGHSAHMYVKDTNFSNAAYAINPYLLAHCTSENNADTGTMPKYGIVTEGGSTTGMKGAQVDGSTADVLDKDGGKTW